MAFWPQQLAPMSSYVTLELEMKARKRWRGEVMNGITEEIGGGRECALGGVEKNERDRSTDEGKKNNV